MKKIVSAFISLFIVFLSFPSFSESSDIYVGIWLHTEHLKSGTLQFIILELKEDNTSVIAFGEADGDDLKVPGRSFIGTWEKSSKGIHVITGHNSTKDLYLSDKDHLEENKYGMVSVYTRINKYIPKEDNTSFDPDSVNQDPCGKWSFMHDFSNENSAGLDFDYISLEIFLFDDGSAYVILGTRSKKTASLNFHYSDGLWLGNSSSLKIKTTDYIFDAWIDDTGHLKLQFTDFHVFSLVRVYSSDIE